MIISQINAFHLLLHTSPLTGQGIQDAYYMDWKFTWVEMGMLALILPISQSYFVGRVYAVGVVWCAWTMEVVVDQEGCVRGVYSFGGSGDEWLRDLWC